VELDVPVPLPDGTVLVADVQLPDGEGPFPALLQRVPYGRGTPAIRDGALDTVRAVRHGYAVVTQDCRGRFESEGGFEPFVHEAADGRDTIAWIRSRPWSDGRVGMFGRSYSGFLQWQAAALRPAGLCAIAPMFSGAEPWPDWFGSDDSLEWGFLGLWSLRQLAPESLRRTGSPAAAAAARAVAAIDDVLAERGAAEEVAAVAAELAWLDDWLDDARRRRWFEELTPGLAAAGAVDLPALVVAGWSDIFLAGSLRAVAAGGGERAVVVGPWPHGGSNPGVYPELGFGPTASGDAVGLTSRQLAWFDRWLRGAGERGRPATWFHPGVGWRDGDRWPPPSDDVAIPLEGLAGPLAWDEDDPVPTIGGATFLPGLEVAANAGPRDQARLLDRPDVASWFGEPLPGPLDVTGAVRCEVVLTAETGARVVVRLVERTPDGRTMLVADGAAVHDGSGLARVGVGPTAWRFEPGSRVGVLVSHTSSPRYRRWLTDHRPAAPRRGRTELRAGSVLHLPVVTIEGTRT
jgi:predicted acyl esterase